MPRWHFNEVHSIPIRATPAEIFRAVREVTPGEMPLVRMLFAIRSLPGLLVGRMGLYFAGSQSLMDQMLDFGFVLLNETPDQEVVFGLVGQPWKLRGGWSPHIADAEEFVAFDGAGYAKAAGNFSLESGDAGQQALRTETRVYVPDLSARRQFGAYWRVIYPGSAFIRKEWLKAIKRRAERTSVHAAY